MNRVIAVILITIISIILTGCSTRAPKIEIVKEYETKVIIPDSSNYQYISAPELPDNLASLTIDEVLDVMIVYSIKLQTTVKLYESRTESLDKWVKEVKTIYKVEGSYE